MQNNIYALLRYFSHLGGPRMKLAALWLMHVTRRRYIGLFIDTVLTCNYSCKMCYFSNEEERAKRRSGRLDEGQLENIANTLFHRVIKLQIGCGAEPTMDMKGALQLVSLGKQHGIPYIAFTTNGALLSYEKLHELVCSGLDELTISLHGIHRATYEQMMGPTANYDAFLALLQSIKRIKDEYPHFNVRVNYTMNADNVDELADFDTLFQDIPINQQQLRPIRKIGESAYQNFDLTHVSECLDSIVRPLAKRCQQKGTTVLFPEQINIERFEGKTKTTPRESLISLFSYININPRSYPRHDIHFGSETYEDYSHRKRLGQRMLKGVFASQSACANEEQSLTNSLNYDIR